MTPTPPLPTAPINSQPQPQQQSSRQKQSQSGVTSPNVTPPLRPGPGLGGPNSGYNTSPGLYGPNVPNVPNVPNFPPGMQMNRSFNSEGSQSGRYPMVPPHMGPPQPHVSSSTHPSNMDSLRGLLSHQNAQNQFNPLGPNYNMGPHPSAQQNGPPTHAQAAAMQQMRNHNYMNNGPGPFGPSNGPNNAAMMQANAMSNIAQRFQMQRFMQPMRPPMMPNVKVICKVFLFLKDLLIVLSF